jgi:hypothetical protein
MSIKLESIKPESIKPKSIKPESIKPESIKPESLDPKDFTNNLFGLLKEFFESPPTTGASCLDQKTGLFDTLNSLSSERVSQRIEEAPSIAAHCEHMRFYQDILIGGLMGKDYGKIDWKQSWLVQTVTDDEWQRLKDNLKQQYQELMALLESFDAWDDYKVGDPMAILAHTAYHLGAIRQLIRFV